MTIFRDRRPTTPDLELADGADGKPVDDALGNLDAIAGGRECSSDDAHLQIRGGVM